MQDKIKYFIKVLFTPTCWVQNNRYSEAWDKILNEIMETNEFVIIDKYIIKIGKLTLWISNHPYASFDLYENGKLRGVRPKRTTMLKAYDKIMKFESNELMKLIK